MNYFLFATHLASILTLAAYLVRDILWLRVLTVVACVAGIVFNYYVPATPLWPVIYWNLVFIAVNAVQIVIIMKERSGVHFTDEERELYETVFKNFAPFEFMKLLRLGKWLEAREGQLLTVEAKPLDNVMLIYKGLASVETGGQEIGQMKGGEMSADHWRNTIAPPRPRGGVQGSPAEAPGRRSRYARIFEQAVWVRIASALADDVNYPNFKDEIHGEADRDATYLKVWSAMNALQQQRKRSGGSAG